MGDLKKKNPKSPSISLPPGFRFHPSEQQLLSFYLINKNQNPNISLSSSSSSSFLSLDVIREIDFYNYDPYNLPEMDSFPYGYGGNKKHWYYFTVSRKGLKRKAKSGFWKLKGRSCNVLGGKEAATVLGTKTTFVFFGKDSSLASSRRLCRTNWVMIEYALVDHQMDCFVLCRVYLKTCSENKVKVVGPNFHAEESFAAKTSSTDVPCKQLEGASTSGIGEVVVREYAFDKGIVKFPHKLNTEMDNQVVVRPFSDDGYGTSLDQRVEFSNGFLNRSLSFNDVVDELRTNSTILEGDFLELDDLVGPLLGIGSSG